MPPETRVQLAAEVATLRARLRKLDRQIAAHRRTQARLSESEARHRALFEHANDLIVLCTLDGTITGVNRSAEALLGWSRDELIGRSVSTILAPASFALGQERVRRSLAGERLPKVFELEAIRKDGALVPLEGWARFILDARGKPVGHQGVYRDVTERKRADAALRASEERYRKAFENATDGIATFSLDGRFTSVNPALERLTGWTRDDLLGEHYTKALTAESAAQAEERTRRALAGEKLSAIFEVDVLRKDGLGVPVEAHTRWIRDGAGAPIGFQGVYRDITERKRAEEALREGEERYRTLFENANDAIATFALDGTVTSLNRALAEAFGYAREELIGHHYGIFVTPATRAEWEDRARRALAGEKLASIAEIEVVKKDGTVMPMEVRGTIIRDKRGTPVAFQAVFRDLTERKRAEETLTKIAELHQTLFREAEEARQVLDRLYRLALSMQASRERDDRLRAFIEGAHEVVGFDRVYVLLVTEDGSALEMVTAHGQQGEAPPPSLPLSPAAGPFYRALQTRRQVTVLSDEDLKAIPSLDPTYLSNPFLRSNRFVIAPLVAGDRAIGAVCADNKLTRRPITPAAVEPFILLCLQLATALEEARLYAETRAREREATKLYEVTSQLAASLDLGRILDLITEKAIEVVGGEASGIYRYDETRGGLTLLRALRLPTEMVQHFFLRPGDGLAGRVFQERRALWTRDLSAETSLAYSDPTTALLAQAVAPRGVLAVPVVRRDEVFGVLVVYFFAPHDFTPKEVQLVSTLADQAAIAIDHARLFQEIEEKSRELEVANRHKSEFLAHMSHELRSPLNAIIGFSEVLLERMFGDLNAKQAEYVDDVLSSGRHLLSLINDILDLSKIEAGRMELELTRFSLPQAIGNALTLVRERASRHGITLTLAVDERLGDVVADERKLKQILLNLLSNAVKFTPEGGRVAVDARLVDGAVEIAVSDTGSGIAPDDQEAVFEEFRQVGSDATRRSEGTGLGLALVRKFVELHGGRIRLASEVGKGATFTVSLPVRTEA